MPGVNEPDRTTPIFISLKDGGEIAPVARKRPQRRKVDPAPQLLGGGEVADQVAPLSEPEILPAAAAPVQAHDLDPIPVRPDHADHTYTLPTQDGDVFEPAYEAHQLRIRGVAWADVAAATGYSSASSAIMAVQAYLQKATLAMSAERQKLALETELARLDALHERWWPAAMGGDEKAANVILKISQQRSKLERLDDEDKSKSGGTKTIVIQAGASEVEYVSALQRVVDDTPR